MENEAFQSELERTLHLVKLDLLLKRCREESLNVTRQDCERAISKVDSDFLSAMKFLRDIRSKDLWWSFKKIFKNREIG